VRRKTALGVGIGDVSRHFVSAEHIGEKRAHHGEDQPHAEANEIDGIHAGDLAFTAQCGGKAAARASERMARVAGVKNVSGEGRNVQRRTPIVQRSMKEPARLFHWTLDENSGRGENVKPTTRRPAGWRMWRDGAEQNAPRVACVVTGTKLADESS